MANASAVIQMLDHEVGGPGSWRKEDCRQVESFQVRLWPEHLADLLPHCDVAQAGHTQAPVPDQFRGSRIEQLMVAVRTELHWGRGFAVLTGLEVADLSEADFERAVWILGSFLGQPAQQSEAGDRVGRVAVDEAAPRRAGFQSTSELSFHSDAYEILGLACVSRAASGGATRLISSLTIHNDLLARCPNALLPLYEGFYYGTDTTGDTISREKIPIFSYYKGFLNSMFLERYLVMGAKLRGESLSPSLESSIDEFKRSLSNEDFAVEFELKDRHVLFCHNFRLLHARTPFINDAIHRRNLLRLWLRDPAGRPYPASLYERGAFYERSNLPLASG